MIEKLMETLKRENINVFRLVLMRRDGACETADRLPSTPCHNCYSISKAVTATAIGMLQDAGRLFVDDSLERYFDLRAYDRDAWSCGKEPGVRVTFDRNLSFRDRDPDLNSRAPGRLLIPGDMRLMEIKTGGAYPLWLTRLLREAGARRTHFSKYGLAYQLYIRPGYGRTERNETICSAVSLSMGA